jgi:hypothetical protein
MAVVTITEYGNTNREQSLPDSTRDVVDQTALTSFASSTQSAAFAAATTVVVVSTDTAIHARVGGTNPTATTSSQYIAAGQSFSWYVKGGDKLAVIAAA